MYLSIYIFSFIEIFTSLYISILWGYCSGKRKIYSEIDICVSYSVCANIFACIHIHIYIYIHIYKHIHIYIYIYIYILIYLFVVCIYICIHVHICMYIWQCVGKSVVRNRPQNKQGKQLYERRMDAKRAKRARRSPASLFVTVTHTTV